MHPKSLRDNFIALPITGGLRLEERTTGAVYELVGLGAVLWQRADGATSVAELATSAGLVGSDVQTAWMVLDQLADSGLIEMQRTPKAAVSRRDLLRQVAMGMGAVAAVTFVARVAQGRDKAPPKHAKKEQDEKKEALKKKDPKEADQKNQKKEQEKKK